VSPSPRQQSNPLRYAPGSEFIAVIAVCGVGGWLLGRWLGWPILGAALGSILGFAGGLWRLIRQALQWQKEYQRDLDRRRGGDDEDAST
jgi:F0F1-type ATP synthase assembly protein I